MPSIFDTAKYILEQRGRTSTMKLQKLCFYAQSWSLVWDDQPLFPEDFEAWANGPMCPELYWAYKGRFDLIAEDVQGDSSLLTDSQKESIDLVLGGYGDSNIQWLCHCTQQEEPWIQARGNLPSGSPCTDIISKTSLAMYYGRKCSEQHA